MCLVNKESIKFEVNHFTEMIAIDYVYSKLELYLPLVSVTYQRVFRPDMQQNAKIQQCSQVWRLIMGIDTKEFFKTAQIHVLGTENRGIRIFYLLHLFKAQKLTDFLFMASILLSCIIRL
jgi:hypothetical protein